ncbi:MAG: ROK family protein [Lachnospiraceae bacterium]|nr:ROK family protein [Lachnospiraceae bacterium]
MLFGALETGGTKMVCAIGNEKGEILEQVSIPTETPELTMPKVLSFYRDKKISALGIGCFGPIDLNRNSATYGHITTTPKTAWQYYDIVGIFERELGVPIGFDTDVNASVLGEYTWGAARGLNSCIYITIGTGIGVGVIADGGLLHGMLHPEGGHILLRKLPEDTYEGFCPFHENCFEGLAAGPAIEGRWGKKALDLEHSHRAWEMEAEYIAQALVNYTCILSPQRIILGGGVMHQTQLFPMIRDRFTKLLNGYLKTKELEDMNTFIVAQSLEDKQGILGALKLAMVELERNS